MFKYALSCLCLFSVISVAACSGSTDDEKTSKNSDDKETNDDGEKTDDGENDDGKKTDDTSGCTGDITNCTLGSLSSKQYDDMCALVAKTIDDAPGTKYECEEGPNQGLYMELYSKEACMEGPSPKSTCKVTVGQTIDCYKAAQKDACGAFSESGACGFFFDSSNGC